MKRVALVMILTALAAYGQPKVVARPKAKLFPKARAARQLSQLERFSAMSAEDRKKALEKLPPERQKQIEANLERYNRMSADEKQRLSGQLEQFRNLPSEQQDSVRKLYREMRDLPLERRQAVRREAVRLQRMPDEDRKAYIASDQFRTRFSDSEQKMVEELSTIVPAQSPPTARDVRQ